MSQRQNRKPSRPLPRTGTPAARGQADAFVFGALALLVLAVFAQAARFPFINFDDGQFVFENPAVRAGLTAASIRWAFTSVDLGYSR